MKKVARIGDYFENNWPDPADIKHMFFDYSENKWASGGASGASFTLYGADGTQGKEPYSERIDIKLSLIDFAQFGTFVQYSKHGGGMRENYFCLWNKDLIGQTFLSRHDEEYSRALVIPFDRSFELVKEFLEQDGKLPTSISWTSEYDLPDEAFPLVDV